MRYLILLAVLAFSCAAPETTEPDLRQLEHSIEGLLAQFNGDAGVYIKHLPTGHEIAINADTVFPTASMVKVPILAALFDRIENGDLEYREKFYFDGQ
ncbi:MAG: class A beta-lactamase-related serine hydrolase, partial [Rhodothermaceae bacterium]|nr:class A beta-lactamase-related serine hydrolase [Rhodothermaceae bacterium]